MRPRLAIGISFGVIGLLLSSRGAATQGQPVSTFALAYSDTVGTTDMPWQRSGAHLNQPWGIGTDQDGVWIANAAGRNVVRYGVGAAEELGRPGSVSALYRRPARWITDVVVRVSGPPTGGTPTSTPTPDPDGGAALPLPRVVWLVDQGAHVVVGIPIDRRGNAGEPTVLGEHGVPGTDNAHFRAPTGIAVAADGSLFVADTGNHRVQVLAEDGHYLATLGSSGTSGNGMAEFDSPARLATGTDHRLYVADTGNRRVQVFDVRMPDAPRWVQTLDGGRPGTLQQPIGVAVDATFVYVADGSMGRVLILRKSDGRLQQALDGGTREGCAVAGGGAKWASVGDVAIDAGGFLYVSLPTAMQVVRCDAFDRHRTDVYGAPGVPYATNLELFNGPAGVAVAADGSLAVVEADGQRVVVRPGDGSATWAYGQPGVAGASENQLSDPTDILRLDDGRWVVADSGNGRLVVLEGSGKRAATWGAGTLQRPTGLALLSGGRLAVADRVAGRVFIVDGTTGAIASPLSDVSGQPIAFAEPADVAVDASGSWYISDRAEHVVRVLDGQGRPLRTLGEPGVRGGDFSHLDTPQGLALDGAGRMYVADGGNARVQVFAADGSYLTTVGGIAGVGTGGLREPGGVALAPDGRLYVADTYNHRVQVFAKAVDPWLPAAVNGFGDPRLRAVTSMAELDGHVYAGTWDSRGGQVWRQSDSGIWLAAIPPGFGDTGTVGVDALISFGEALYAGVEHQAMAVVPGRPPMPVSKGAEVWRSSDGAHWDKVAAGGFGQERLAGIGAFAPFQGQLYVGTRALDGGTELTLWRSESGDVGSWRKVNIETGRHDEWSQSYAISAMTAFSNTLFVGTCAAPHPQIWSSGNVTRWQGVGAWRDQPELTAAAQGRRCVSDFAAYDGWLYAALGGEAPELGGSRYGASAPLELLRCRRCDGSDWEPAAAPGLGRSGNNGPVAMATLDEPPFRYLYLSVGNVAEGVEVWRARDGLDWEPVAVGGLGDDNNVAVGGGRAMAVFHGRLHVGTVNTADGGELWSTAGTRPLVLPTPPAPPVTATPRPNPQPPSGRARYEKVGEWPIGSVAAADVLGNVVDMAVADDGTAYLLDANPARVTRLSSAGLWAQPFGDIGSGPDRVTEVESRDLGAHGGLAVDSSRGRVYVTDLGTERIVIFDLAGRYLESIPDVFAVDLDLLPDGTFWAADLLAGAIRRLRPDGTEVERLLSFGPDVESQSFNLVSAVEDPGGRLWVSDQGGRRLRAFERAGGAWHRTRTVDMTRRVFEACSAVRLQVLADNTLLLGACVVTAGRLTAILPSDHRGSDLYGAHLRTVNLAAGHFFALAGHDPDPDNPANEVFPAVVQYADAGFARVIGSWPGRRFVAENASPEAIVGPRRISVAPSGDLFVRDTLGHRRFSPDGKVLDALPLSLYPSRHAALTLDPRLTVGTGRPGQVVGVGNYVYGRAGSALEVVYANRVQRRRCEAGKCTLGLYLDVIWDTTLSREHNEYMYAVAHEPTRDQFVLLQVFKDNPGYIEFPARLYLFPLGGMGRKTEVVLPGKDREALWVDVDAGPDGRIYALDALGDRILVLDAAGNEVGFVPTPKDSWKVAGGPNGEMFVLTTYGHVVRLAADGMVLSRFVGLPNPLAPGTALVDLAVDAWNRVYVVDELYNQVTVFEPTGREDDVLVGDRCTLAGDKWVAPTDLLLGNSAQLSLSLFGSCGYQEEPSDIVLAVSVPGGETTHAHLRVARQLLSLVDLDRHRVGLVPFVVSAVLDTRLTQDRETLIRALFAASAGRATGCGVNTMAALRVAKDAFADSPPGRRKVLVIVHGGIEPEPGACPWDVNKIAALAGELKAAGVTIVAVNPANSPSIAASSEILGRNLVAPRGQGEGRVALRRTLSRVWPDALLQSGTLRDTLPANIDYVPGSAQPPAAWDAASRTLTWTLRDLARTDTHAFSLRILPRAEGLWPTNVEAVAEGIDGWGKPIRASLPIPKIRVYGALPPSPTSSPTRTPSPTSTGTSEPTPTTGPTRPPRPIYLPLLLHTQPCQPDTRNADVALVIDTSGSMSEATRPGGPTKLAAAQDAARAFLGQLKAGRDQAALIQFNNSATVTVALTPDIAAVTAGLASLSQASGTRIDEALDAAVAELTGPLRRSANNPVIVLLTDGEPTGVTPDEVRKAALRARSAGLLVFTIGLGSAVDHALLGDVASRPEWYFFAPDTTDLAAIYGRIVYELPCRPQWPLGDSTDEDWAHYHQGSSRSGGNGAR